MKAQTYSCSVMHLVNQLQISRGQECLKVEVTVQYYTGEPLGTLRTLMLVTLEHTAVQLTMEQEVQLVMQ